MPPKGKYTREEVIKASLRLIAEEGAESFSARKLSLALSCSTQPIFSLFSSMEELRYEVVSAAYCLYEETISREMEKGSYLPYKAAGMGYVRFASEYPRLFKMLFMNPENSEQVPALDTHWQSMTALAARTAGVDAERADLFHFDMWVVVHGLGTMAASGYPLLTEELASRVLSDMYTGLSMKYRKEEGGGT